MSDGNGASQEPQKPKWYHTTSTLVIGLLVVGPFALPLLWINPRYSPAKKLLWTVVVLALTYTLTLLTIDTGKKVIDQYRQLGLIK